MCRQKSPKKMLDPHPALCENNGIGNNGHKKEADK